MFVGAAHRDAEADVGAADIGHEPQYRGVIEVVPAR